MQRSCKYFEVCGSRENCSRCAEKGREENIRKIRGVKSMGNKKNKRWKMRVTKGISLTVSQAEFIEDRHLNLSKIVQNVIEQIIDAEIDRALKKQTK